MLYRKWSEPNAPSGRPPCWSRALGILGGNAPFHGCVHDSRVFGARQWHWNHILMTWWNCSSCRRNKILACVLCNEVQWSLPRLKTPRAVSMSFYCSGNWELCWDIQTHQEKQVLKKWRNSCLWGGGLVKLMPKTCTLLNVGGFFLPVSEIYSEGLMASIWYFASS